MLTTQHGFSEQGAATRPIIRGKEMVVASGHHLASLIGMRMKELGGNAFDAGVAMVFAQTVLECHTGAGFGGEVPILIYSAKDDKVVSVNGNMYAPAAATPEEYRRRGITDLIPGDGLLAAGVCAIPGTLISVLDRYGNLTLEEVLSPTVELARDGFPLDETFVNTITREADKFRSQWPTSAALFLPGGEVPAVGRLWKNPDLASVLEKLIEAEKKNKHNGRSAGLKAAIDRFYRGDIAQQLVAWQHENEFQDSLGLVSNGLLTEEDFANYDTHFEEPVTTNYHGYDVYKCPPWSQGPMMLQTLNILEKYDLQSMQHNSAKYIHVLSEAMKLGFADRERYYGDPKFADVPLEGLLSKEYATKRQQLINHERASLEIRPGNPYPYQGSDFEPDLSKVTGRAWSTGTTGTRAVDAEGNMFSAAPSGGWFHSSPIIEGMGFCLGTRMQMFWLGDKAHPGVLEPKKQPRTTLTPTLIMKDGKPHMVLGTPGADQQEQWSLQVFLNIVEFGMDIQDAIDMPNFVIQHVPSSFYPRGSQPGLIKLEGRIPNNVVDKLESYGYNPEIGEQWSQNAVTAISYNPSTKIIQGGASSRRESMYALGW